VSAAKGKAKAAAAPRKTRAKPKPFMRNAKEFDAEKVCDYLFEIMSGSKKGVHGALAVMRKKYGHAPTHTTVRKWIAESDKAEDEAGRSIADKYARAKEEQAHFFAEETIGIADGDEYKEKLAALEEELMQCKTSEEVDLVKLKIGFALQAAKDLAQRDRLRVDARKWQASKLMPKVYGDRQILQGDDEADPIRVQNNWVVNPVTTKHGTK
jgi:hypothetical protein